MAPNSVWHSEQACAAIFNKGKRHPKAKGKLRIGSWNIRWFPMGNKPPDPGVTPKPNKRQPTNVKWAACAIGYYGVDVLAVQEILHHSAKHKRALKDLLEALSKLTGSKWKAKVDDCPGAQRIHVGFMWNTAAVTAKKLRVEPMLTPSGKKCERVRPGYAGYFRSKKKMGADFHLISVHIKSGVQKYDFFMRRKSWKKVPGVVAKTLKLKVNQGKKPDPDIILLGDWNSMGCKGNPNRAYACKKDFDTAAELAWARKDLGGALRILGAKPACSEYASGHGVLLDHFVVANAMTEAIPNPASPPKAQIVGYCAIAKCNRISPSRMPAAYYNVSDHCPVLLDIDDKDHDQ